VFIKKGPPHKGLPANLTQLREALKSTWAIIMFASLYIQCVRVLQMCCKYPGWADRESHSVEGGVVAVPGGDVALENALNGASVDFHEGLSGCAEFILSTLAPLM
jgi:hypothetical protein